MLHPSLRRKPHATSIWPKCPQHQQDLVKYNINCEKALDTAQSTRPQQHIYKARKNLGVLSPNASQSAIYDKFDRGQCLYVPHDWSSGSLPSLKKESSISNDAKAANELIRFSTKRRKPKFFMRIFCSLISRDDYLDDTALHGLLLAADKTVFCGRLCGRVRWEWSTGQPEYEHELLGTTALRPANSSMGGFETLIVLSKPLLQNKHFSRDLLISAFLHELVHSYLFIRCGLDHAKDDGHTEGFQTIANFIDTNFGQERLHLCNMRANLDHFLVPKMPVRTRGGPSVRRQSWIRQSSRRSELSRSSSTDEGYFSRDRSPNIDFSSNDITDEGNKTRGQSPRASCSSDSTNYYVVQQTGVRNGHVESQCSQNTLRL